MAQKGPYVNDVSSRWLTEDHEEERDPLVVGDQVGLVVDLLALLQSDVHRHVVGALHEAQIVGVVHPRLREVRRRPTPEQRKGSNKAQSKKLSVAHLMGSAM